MKKKLLSLALLTLLSSNLVQANDTYTLNVEGEITSSSCTIPADEMTRAIDVGKISAADATDAAAGETVFETDMDFHITNCNGHSKLQMQFGYNPAAEGNEYLANSGDAQGVLLSITDAAGNGIQSGEKIESTDYDSLTGVGTIVAKVKAIRVGTDAAVEGNIASIATLTFDTQ